MIDTTHRFRDQLCSLAFSLSGIYFVGCSYVVGFHSDQFGRCNQATPWGIPFLLGVLPLLARFFQSLRRWSDSNLNSHSSSHLINASLFFPSDVSELIDTTLRVVNISWGSCTTFSTVFGDIAVSVSPRGFTIVLNVVESKGSKHDTSFVFFCVFGIINSLYASSWVRFGFLVINQLLTIVCQDLLVDWSVLRLHARFVFLRDELIYSSSIPVRFSLSFRDYLPHLPDATPSVVLLHFHRKWSYLFLERAVQLTHSTDHQHSHPLHMDNIPPNERAHHAYSFVYSCAPRSAAALSVERLYVDFARLLYTRSVC